jgi:hypothetical protein
MSIDRGRLLLAAALGAGLILSGCGSGGSSSPPTREQGLPVSSTVGVVYLVRGTAQSATWTVQTPTGTKQGDADVPLMNKSGSEGLQFLFEPGDFVYISAQNDGETGTVECSIVADGTVISQNEASGAFAIATCEGQA